MDCFCCLLSVGYAFFGAFATYMPYRSFLMSPFTSYYTFANEKLILNEHVQIIISRDIIMYRNFRFC